METSKKLLYKGSPCSRSILRYSNKIVKFLKLQLNHCPENAGRDKEVEDRASNIPNKQVYTMCKETESTCSSSSL